MIFPVPVAEVGVCVCPLCVHFRGSALLGGAVILLRPAAALLLGQNQRAAPALPCDLLHLGGGFRLPQGRGTGGGHAGRRSTGALYGFLGLFERRRKQEKEGETLHDPAVMRA